jgi:DNA end-binding protein Ku
MPRVIWKGAISFGLVHIPVALYPASREDDINFDWLDKRSMDPVGYKRINKRTGKEIDKENIVKGIKREEGEYVVLSDEDIKNAYPKTTQTIEIEAFVSAQDIPFVFLERPYYLAPIGKGEKVYALLREALLDAGRVGIARVVMQNKQHLAALIPTGAVLMLNTLRWATEVRPIDELKIPEAGKKAAGLKESELKMARQLVEDMVTDWKPEEYVDHFKEAIMALVEEKVEAGETETVQPLEDQPEEAKSSNVIDVTELLKRSLNKGKKPAAPPKTKRAAARKSTKSASVARKHA